MNTDTNKTEESHVTERIRSNDGWYTFEQFKWAALPYIRNIYEGRFTFIRNAIGDHPLTGEPHLLELGCGDGYWLKRLEEHSPAGLKLSGVDYNPLRIDRAREVLSGEVKLEVADLNQYEPAPVDIILCMHVIEHIPDDTAFLSRVAGMISPGGMLILGTPNEGNYLMQRRNRKKGIFRSTDHQHFYVEELITSRIEKAGLRITGRYYDPFYLLNDRLFYRMLSKRTGYKILSRLARLFPYYASGYIFQCKLKEEL